MKLFTFGRVIVFCLFTGVLLAGVKTSFGAVQQKSPYILLDSISRTETGGKLGRIRGLFWSSAQNQLLVTDTGNNRLLFFGYRDGRLKLITEFKPEKMKTPLSAVETRQGKILVIEQGLIVSYELKTGAKSQAVSNIPDADTFCPSRLALDDRDNLYVLDQGNNKIYIFDSNFVYKSQITPGASGRFAAVKPDKEGNILALDPVQGSIYVYGADGKAVRQFGRKGSSRSELEFPADMAVDHQAGVYILDSHAHKVSMFDKKTGWKGSIGNKGWKEGDLIYPSQIEVDSDYRLYIIDSDDGRLQVLIPAQGLSR